MMEMAETRDSTFIICQSKLSAVCEGNFLGWGVSRFFSSKFTNLEIWPPLTVNLVGLLLGNGWVSVILIEMMETRDSTFIICQSKLSALCSGNIFD